jgi:hypothetical protein
LRSNDRAEVLETLTFGERVRLDSIRRHSPPGASFAREADVYRFALRTRLCGNSR